MSAASSRKGRSSTLPTYGRRSTRKFPAGKTRGARSFLIDQLRGATMPAGIVKTNGRVEATRVDVAAEYAAAIRAAHWSSRVFSMAMTA